MPADGADFPRTVLEGRRFVIPFVTIRKSAGTYSVVLKYNGSDVTGTLTESTTYPFFYTSPTLYKDNNHITIKVNSSNSCADFEAIFTLVEV